MHFVQKKIFFKLLVVLLVFILQRQQPLWAERRVKTAVEATFIFVHIPTFLKLPEKKCWNCILKVLVRALQYRRS